MNQRIKELIEQATSHMPGRPPYEGLTFDVFNKEKFTELIIKECADFLKDKLDDHFAAEQLVEHFGVKDD